MIYKTELRKLKIEQHEPHKKTENDLRGEETHNLPLFQDANVTVCIRHLLSVYPNKIYNI
jgi:hypothetical protein